MVEFVSYNGAPPNLCTGTLVVRINGIEHELRGGWRTEGTIDGIAETKSDGKWVASYNHLPKEIRKYHEGISEVMNLNIPLGCCGGCL